MKTRPAHRPAAGTGNSRDPERAGQLTADHQVINRRALISVSMPHCDGSRRASAAVRLPHPRHQGHQGHPGTSGSPGASARTARSPPGRTHSKRGAAASKETRLRGLALPPVIRIRQPGMAVGSPPLSALRKATPASALRKATPASALRKATPAPAPRRRPRSQVSSPDIAVTPRPSSSAAAWALARDAP